MNNDILSRLIKSEFKGRDNIRTKELITLISRELPDIKESSIRWRINQLKTEEVIFQIGRGLYSLANKPDYKPVLSLKTKRLYNRTVSDTQSHNVAIWETTMLNALSSFAGQKNLVFLLIDKSKMDGLFNEMLDYSKVVFLNPSEEVISRYVLIHDYAVIILPAISEAPVDQYDNISMSSLEMLLVDCFVLNNNYIKQIGYDINDVYSTAFKNYKVNTSKLLRYASRRDKRNEIESVIRKIN